ncbi:MAG: MFS transporter [Cytophagaceae bacterium]|jgi:UMF1 family MFS transporter|nr:MFS transporter [Cytophagaceae bacterium]
MQTKKNDPGIIRGWCMYDWANSVYSLTITTVVFPIYWSNVVKGENGSSLLSIAGLSMKSEDLYSFTLSFSFLLIAFINPLLSGIADYSNKKKSFMRMFAWMGAFSCAALYGFNQHTLWLGVLAFMLATIGYAGSLVFYNAYLPEIVTEDQMDRVSARGFSMGYIGSLILLVVNLITITFWEFFHFSSDGDAVRFAFLSVGLWWFVFSYYSLAKLPPEGALVYSKGMFSKGYEEVVKVWNQLKGMPILKTYLLAFWFYTMSFQTIMYLASLFGKKELGMEDNALIGILLVIQLVAIAGAFLFSYSSRKYGNIQTLVFAVILCVFVCIAAYFTTTSAQFFALAFFVGLIMGGIQSLSRSTYAKLLPPSEDHASYFSFYELTDKLGTALGTAMFGVLNVLTGNMRSSIIVLIVFFGIGIWQLRKIKHVK